ncbi:MAG: tetratricopeptide repeat protein, partial [Trueperaceae bacterium]
LEEWIYATRETLAARAREALLHLAEDSAAMEGFDRAADQAHRAYLLPGAPEPEAEDLERVYALLRAAEHPAATEVRKEAGGYGLNLQLSPGEARASLRLEVEPARREVSHNLPVQPTGFIGREAEMAKLGELLGDPECRLLTIAGPGGIGKTRLAVEVARQQLPAFPDGVYFVSFVSVETPTQMTYAVSDALDFSLLGTGDPQAQLLRRLENHTVLLLLDNLEHLLDDTSLIQRLIAEVPTLKLLVTSREPLDLQAEHIFDLHGLEVPTRSTDIANFDAVKLFLQSAYKRRADFTLDPTNSPPVSRICKLVGGQPLALELAASWLRLLDPDDIASEIETGIDFLHATTRDLPVRHRSIRAVLEHSWGLLNQLEQAALLRLAVFRGGFTREAAFEVAGTSLDILAGLVDKSLLEVVPGGRYRRHPLVIQYTREKLESQPEVLAQARERHGSYYLRLLQQRGKDLQSLRRKQALAILEADVANIEVAWHWAVEQGQALALTRSAEAIRELLSDRIADAQELFAFAASRLRVDDPEHQVALGYVLIEQTLTIMVFGGVQAALTSAMRGLEMVKVAKDEPGILQGLFALAWSQWVAGDFQRSKETCEEGLERARHLSDAGFVAKFLALLALALKEFDILPETHAFYQNGLTEIRQLDCDPQYLAAYLHFMAFFLLHNGDLHLARGLELESLQLFKELGFETWLTGPLDCLGMVAYKLGEIDEAATRLQQALTVADEVGHPFMQAYILGNLARVAVVKGDHAVAEQHLKQGLRIALNTGNPVSQNTILVSLAELRIAQDQPNEAAAWLALAARHPQAERHDRVQAQQVLADLQERLPPAEFEAATLRGQELELEEVVQQLLTPL